MTLEKSTESTLGMVWLRYDASRLCFVAVVFFFSFPSHHFIFHTVTGLFLFGDSCHTGGLLSLTWSMEQLGRCGLLSWRKRALCLSTALTRAGKMLCRIVLFSFSFSVLPFPLFLHIFTHCFSRSMELVYQRPGEMNGIPLYRYVAPKTLFANGTDYAPNEGFCPCRQSGLLNVSSCRHSE